jgi:hypothetical protein
MEFKYLVSFILLGIFGLMFYISLLTGFFATYYYDNKIHTKIKIHDTNEGYFSHILYIAGIFLINIIVLLNNKIIGIIIYCILLVFSVLINFLVKNNMKNITEIYCVSIRPPASVKFKSKLMTILLSPVTNGVMISIILAFIVLICIILTVL